MNVCTCKVEVCNACAARLEIGEGEYLHAELSVKDKHSDYPMNRHNVDLERVQRIQLGIDVESMEFSEESVAQMLQEMADERPAGHSAFVLRSLANALRGEDRNHRLVLKQTKRGKWVSPSDDHTRRRQNIAWLWRLDRLQNEGWQTDAAIHRIAETTGNSVATVYARISSERAWQSEIQSIVQGLGKIQVWKNKRKPD